LGFNVRQGENRNAIHRDNVGAKVLMAESMKMMVGGRAKDGANIGMAEAIARAEGEAQRRGGGGIHRNGDSGESGEGGWGDVEIRDGDRHIENVGVLVANTIKKMGIGRLVGQVVHGFIKGNVSRLDSFRDGVKV
jgi:hypothetical protein